MTGLAANSNTMDIDSNTTTANNRTNIVNDTMSSTSNGQAYATPAATRLKSSYDINLIRLIGQHLNSLGLTQTVELLLRETGMASLDHPLADRIQRHILDGEFDAASSLVEGLAELIFASPTQTQPPQSEQNELLKLQQQSPNVIATGGAIKATATTTNTSNNHQNNNSTDNKEVKPCPISSLQQPDEKQTISRIKLAIAKQKYLELLEDGRIMEALKCLQSEITPHADTSQEYHAPFLATLTLCKSPADLKQRANWPGKGQQSRQLVIEKIRNHVPPLLILPPKRLTTLLNQAAQLQRDRCAFHVEQYDESSPYTCNLLAKSNSNESNENHQKLPAASNGNAPISGSSLNSGKPTNGHCVNPTTSSPASSSTTPSASSSSMSLDVISNSITNHTDLVCDHVCSADKFPMQRLHDYDNHKSEVWFCQFSHDGLKLATGGVRGVVRIWHLDPVKEELIPKCTLDCPNSSITCLSWSPDDCYLLACGINERCELWVFNVNKEELHNTISNSDMESYTTCSWHMSSKRFAAGNLQGNFQIYDPDGNRLGMREGVRVQCLSFLHKDPKYILAADNQHRIRAYSLEDMCRHTLDDRDVIEESFPICSFAVSSDDKYIAVNLHAQGVHLWEYQTRTLMRVYSGVTQRNMAVFSSFSSLPGPSFLASGSEDGNVYIYHTNKSDRPLAILTGHSRCVNCVTWNPRYPEFLVSVGDDRLVTLWGPDKGGQMRSLSSTWSLATS